MNEKKKLCIVYHSEDMDGWLSAYYGLQIYPEADILGINYAFDDISLLENYDKIVLIDMTLSPEFIKHLDAKKIKIDVYDHHISRYDEYKDLPCNYYFDVNKCGAKIFANENNFPENRLLQIVDEYDRFDFDAENPYDEHHAFTAGIYLYHWDPRDYKSFRNLHENVDDFIEEGYKMLDYQKAQSIFAVKNSRRVDFNGLKTLLINSLNFSTINYLLAKTEKEMESYFKNIDILLSFHQAGSKWKYSLRAINKEIDVSKIAKKYGGGGHRGAAGFYTEEVLDIYNKIKFE